MPDGTLHRSPATPRPPATHPTGGRVSHRHGALPGDPGRDERLARIVRVDHAGEYGAKRIYEGQIAVLGKGRHGPTLRHMAEQEAVHLRYFEEQIVLRRARPTVIQPFWHVAGFVLGAGTALLGERAAMACTVAVEEVIDNHYEHQVEALGGEEPDLVAAIRRFQAEEVEHRDIGLANDAEKAPAYPLLSAAIKAGTRAAIWVSERF